MDPSLSSQDPEEPRRPLPKKHVEPGPGALARNGQAGAGLDYVAREDPDEDSLHWQRQLVAIWRQKWLVGLGLVFGLGAALLVQNQLEPTYQTRATVWIETGDRTVAAGAGPIQPTQLLSSSGWVDLMRSQAVIRPVVDSLRLFVETEDPAHDELFAELEVDEGVRSAALELVVSATGDEWILLDAEGAEMERVAAGEVIGASRGMRWAPPPEHLPPGTRVAFHVRRPSEMARRLADDLDVRVDRDGTFLAVTLDGRNPERIARTLNGLTSRYVRVAEELKRAKLDGLTESLAEQLAFAGENLSQAELALENFRVSTITQPSEEGTPAGSSESAIRNPVFESYQNLQVEAEEVARDRLAIERAMTRSRDQGRLATETLELVPSVRASSDLSRALDLVTEKRAELRAQRLHYTDEHLSTRELLADLQQLEQVTVPSLIENLLDELDGRRAEIERFMAQAATDLEQIPPRAVEETRLSRRFRSAEALFVDLQNRYEAARLGAASTVPDVWVLDQAPVPEFPASDPGGRILLLGTLAGLGLGLLGALVRDRRDVRLRTPDQVTRDLGLPILSAIPHARTRGGKLREEDHDRMLEAFRNLRLATEHAHGRRGPLALTVSSPGPGDGKSFTVSNLALAFIGADRRTLVIDGDVRRGVMHHLFDLERTPGLTDHLAGDARIDEILRSTEHDLLTVIPAGSVSSDAPELLTRRRMEALLDELRSCFDVVLIDSPPLNSAVDPYVLGTLAGSLMVVLRNGATDRVLAETRLGELGRLPVQVVGAVLNDVPAGSGEYRYYAYPSGYEVPRDGRSGSGLPKVVAGPANGKRSKR